MPLWAFVAGAFGVIIAVALLIVAVNVGTRFMEKRRLLTLLVHAENVDAGERTLKDLCIQLSDAEDEVLGHLADDPDAVERRVLQELTSRLGHLAVELDEMPLPQGLVPVAEALADASFLIARESGRIQDDDRGDVALDHLGEIDLVAVKGYAGKARAMVLDAAARYGLEETAVYGGGLYL